MWVPTTAPLPTLVAEQHPSKVRLGLQDGTHADITWPVMIGDSMIGSDSAAVQPVHVREVATVKVQEFSLIKTLVLAITVPMTALVILCAISGGCYVGD